MQKHKKFKIELTCTDSVDRPPISYKVRDYFEDFMVEQVFKKHKIIVNTKWDIMLSLLFVGAGERHTLRDVTFIRGHRTIKSDSIKLYEMLLPLIVIQEAQNPQLKTIELIYEALVMFVITNYKKVKIPYMNELWNQVDVTYLLSLPYPAPLSDQRYVGDTINSDGSISIY
ncbi:MAG: hypothetical protein V4613_14310 [Bacteroidota bacterium]